MLTELKQKPENVRKRISLYTTLAISLLIFSGWFYSNNFFGILNNSDEQSGAVVTAEEPTSTTPTTPKASSPLENIFSQLSEQYNNLKESIASVMVPFITGIDVYSKDSSK